MVWIDLEMTGLDITKDRILEAAVLVTDGDLNVLHEGPELVIHQPDDLLDAMNDWNRKHHGQSGLIERVRASSTSVEEAEAALLESITPHCEAGAAPLAGNSIQQDRLFIATFMPRLNAHLHYRNVDVSTLKELVRRWYPDVFTSRPTKKGQHRALQDIIESVEELRYYREKVFVALQ